MRLMQQIGIGSLTRVYLNTQHTIMHSQNIGVRAGLEPLKDLKIDLTLTRNFTNNSSEFYRFNDSLQDFQQQSRFVTTNVTYTTISLQSAFGEFE